MIGWISVKDKYPKFNKRVLLYWSCSDHIEDGMFFKDGNFIYHTLFDGESLNDQPSHWMDYPEKPKN